MVVAEMEEGAETEEADLVAEKVEEEKEGEVWEEAGKEGEDWEEEVRVAVEKVPHTYTIPYPYSHPSCSPDSPS